jgi:hypothetical protein
MLQAKFADNIKTHSFFFENRAVYETMWKNTVKPDMPRMAIWLTRIACWIPIAASTQS